MSGAAGALSGVRICDFSRILAGPSCTQILGDLGADVIKIERPGAGDDTRGWGPPYLKDASGEDSSESAYYLGANRNKRSIAVDLANTEGQALARRLIAKSDVVIENLRQGAMARYGLGWTDLEPELPGLVYCSITGFGQTGPYAAYPGYDFMIQAMGGLMSVTGEPEGEPMKVGVPISDIMSGMYAAVAVLAALHHRNATGRGQYIDIALLDCQVAWLYNQAMNYLIGGVVPRRMGNSHPNLTPYEPFPTKDGYVVLAIGNDQQFRRFCLEVGLAWMPDDPRFADNRARVRHRPELLAILRKVFARDSTAGWLAFLRGIQIPCAPINDIEQVFQDPQVRERGMRTTVPHRIAPSGRIPAVASPLRMSATPPSYRHGPPVLGEHTDAILEELLGCSAAEIAALKARGVVASADER